MVPGLQLSTFQTMFPEFSTVSPALIQTFLDLVNNGYQFVQENITDTVVLNIFYFLVAHFVAVSTNQIVGTVAGPSGSFMPTASSAGLVSLSFQQVENYSADQAFMLSTRYGQTFYYFQKQQYIQNFYLSGYC